MAIRTVDHVFSYLSPINEGPKEIASVGFRFTGAFLSMVLLISGRAMGLEEVCSQSINFSMLSVFAAAPVNSTEINPEKCALSKLNGPPPYMRCVPSKSQPRQSRPSKTLLPRRKVSRKFTGNLVSGTTTGIPLRSRSVGTAPLCTSPSCKLRPMSETRGADCASTNLPIFPTEIAVSMPAKNEIAATKVLDIFAPLFRDTNPVLVHIIPKVTRRETTVFGPEVTESGPMIRTESVEVTDSPVDNQISITPVEIVDLLISNAITENAIWRNDSFSGECLFGFSRSRTLQNRFCGTRYLKAQSRRFAGISKRYCAPLAVLNGFNLSHRYPSPFVEFHRFNSGIHRPPSLYRCLLRSTPLSSSVESINAYYDYAEETDARCDPEAHPLTPVFDKGVARFIVFCCACFILVLFGLFIRLVEATFLGVNEHGPVLAVKVGAVFGTLLLIYLLVHASLDLLEWGAIFGNDLL